MKIPEQWKAESTHKTNPLNTKALRQQVAQKLIEENKYCF